MSTSSFIDVFNNVEETIQKKRIKKAGIYTKVNFTKAEYVVQEEDTEKKKKGYSCLVITFEVPDGDDVAEFEHRIFAPPTREEDVKFVSKKYEKGVAVRDLTPAEQIGKFHNDILIELLQLVQATGLAFEQAKEKLRPAIPETADYKIAFKHIAEGFVKLFADGSKSLMDIKIVVTNSEKNKTSSLGISRATLTNLSFANHVEGRPTRLQFSDYEVKNCMQFKYTGKQNPPTSNDGLVDNNLNASLDMNDGMGAPAPTGPEYNEDLF
jgi:hypothetical protein